MKVRAFTDGACSVNPGCGGWGVVFNNSTSCKTFSGNETHTTNNRMELKAVLECYRIANKSKKIKELEVYSDSAYVVNSINNAWVYGWLRNGWKTAKGDDVKNTDLWKELLELIQQSKTNGLKVHIIKIKGHAGNTFNEMADKLAKSEVLKAKKRL